jgi:hypothetical protein
MKQDRYIDIDITQLLTRFATWSPYGVSVLKGKELEYNITKPDEIEWCKIAGFDPLPYITCNSGMIGNEWLICLPDSTDEQLVQFKLKFL